ncbi:MAG: copper amine oxidase N-terminal domain-containing protein, partial [Desulfitobacteriaceae bacterium]|nr:copper amine oxidase N-terminal domain-containing protein [Desulfitobacteriaceae bacterium]
QEPTVLPERGFATGVAGGISSIEEVALKKDPPGPPSGGGGGGGGAPLPKQFSMMIYRDLGGIVPYLSVVVTIPADTLPADSIITIRKLTEEELDNYNSSGVLMKLGSDVFEITTSGTAFFGDDKFITIKIAYDPAKISAGERPVLSYFDTLQGKWVNIPTTLEYNAETGRWFAVVKVNHLTTFAVISAKPACIRLIIGEPLAFADEMQYTLDAAPFVDISAGRTLVPARFLSEIMGAKVEWIADTKQMIIIKDSHKIVLTIGSEDVWVDGVLVKTDCAPQIEPPGRTFVPIRFISETLGCKVDYQQETKEINIIP